MYLTQDYDAGETELMVQLGVLNQNVNPGVSEKINLIMIDSIYSFFHTMIGVSPN